MSLNCEEFYASSFLHCIANTTAKADNDSVMVDSDLTTMVDSDYITSPNSQPSDGG